jgi:hypothetical protein
MGTRGDDGEDDRADEVDRAAAIESREDRMV